MELARIRELTPPWPEATTTNENWLKGGAKAFIPMKLFSY